MILVQLTDARLANVAGDGRRREAELKRLFPRSVQDQPARLISRHQVVERRAVDVLQRVG